MSDFSIALLIIYTTVTVLLALIAISAWVVDRDFGHTREAKQSARLVFLAPLWPVALLIVPVKLWRDADWFGGGR